MKKISQSGAVKPVLLTGALALALALVVTPAHAVMQLSAQIGAGSFSCFDNQAGCDTNVLLGILDTGTVTIGGVLFSGSFQTQTIGPNVLNTSSSQIINNTGAPVAFTVAVGGTNFVGPVDAFSASAAETFQSAVGSNITLGFFGDPANQQGADNPTDTPGILLANFVDTATLSPQSSSHNFSGPFVDADLHSLTVSASGTLTNGGTLVGRLQAIETHLAPVPVPEPATLMLFGSSLVGLGIFGRRHRKNIAA